MSWKVALLVALLNGIITAVVTAPVADHVTKRMGVSDFEGKRGYAIAFIFIPAGFVGGFLAGLLGTNLAGAVAWSGFWKAAGLGLVLAQGALFTFAGLGLLSVPRPPLLHGEALALEVEVRLPPALVGSRTREPDQLRMSLYAGDKDNHYARIDRDRFTEEDGHLAAVFVADLNSRSARRILSLGVEDHTWLAFDLDGLAPSPTEKDLEWSAPAPMRDARTAGERTVRSAVMLRYRVIRAGRAD